MDAATPPELRPAAPLSQAEIRSTFYGLMLAMFLSALDSTIVATAMPTIGRDLGDSAHLAWIVTAYLVASTAVTPLYGKFADMHGRRVTMLFAIAIFILGSIACALAPSLLWLAIGRAVQGFGGGGLIALAQTIIADLVTPRERGRWQGYFGAVFAGASVLGPVLGGFFAQSLHWSAIFWINLPLGLLALALVNDKLKRLPATHRRHRLDVVGAILLVLATSLLMLTVSWGGTAYSWSSPVILALICASTLAWLGFGIRLASASEPLIPLAVLADRVVASATATSALAMGAYIGLTIMVPIFFETGLGLSSRESGLALIGMMVGVPIGATASGRAMAVVRHYKRAPFIGLSVATVSVATFAATLGSAPLWLVEILLAGTALGLGTVFPVTTVAIQNAVDPHHLGTATATMNFLRQLVGALVVAVFGALALGGGVPVEGTAAAHVAGDPASFRLVFWLAAALYAVSLLLFVFMEERPLRGRAPAPSHAPD